MESDIQDASRIYYEIKAVLENARNTAYKTVNFSMVAAYWQIGKIIVEEEQKGMARAEYGESLISELSVRLMNEFGRGFNQTNLKYMRLFYLKFQNGHALRDELSWTHYRLLSGIEKEDARQFYVVEAINSRWSTRELERQINSLLYERIAMSKDKEKVRELSEKGHIIKHPEDIIKDPYVLEFLGVKDNKNFLEKDLEQLLIERLKDFLLELGKGFSFVARQKRISMEGDHFYIDLVFYNYILKCFVLIDLKIGKLTHSDIGQMDFYVRYFEKEERQEGDNPAIGLILCSEKNETMAKYTILNDNKCIFASKYKLCLPSEEELRDEITKERGLIEMERRLNEASRSMKGRDVGKGT